MAEFSRAVEWVRRYLLRWGYDVEEVRVDPEREQWEWYSGDGQLVLRLCHREMERVRHVFARSEAKRIGGWR